MKTLEKHVASLVAACEFPDGTTYDIYAFELWGNAREGFSVNDGWRMARGADLETLLENARGRWEVFKANYMPRARVSDISDAGDADMLCLEVDGVSYLEIRAIRPTEETAPASQENPGL